MVIIDLPAPDDESIHTDEAYGDFAYYLNNFASEAPEGLFEFVKLNSSDLKGIDALLGPLKPLSTVFLHSTKSSFVHDGTILEPGVYRCIQAEYTGESKTLDSIDKSSCPNRFQFAGF